MNSSTIEQLNENIKNKSQSDLLFGLYDLVLEEGVKDVAQKTGLNRESIYKIFKCTGGLNLASFWDILNAVGLDIRIVELDKNHIPKGNLNNQGSLASLFPQIAQLWHPTKNKLLNPNLIIPSSRKLIWFRCPKGHEWQQMPITLFKDLKSRIVENLSSYQTAFDYEVVCLTCSNCLSR